MVLRLTCLLCLLCFPASVRAQDLDPLAGLYDRIAADVQTGHPVILQAHVALCDNVQVRCGSRGLGDGDSLARNLYWATSGGMVGWFTRPGSGWRQVLRQPDPEPGVLEMRVFHRVVPPDGALRTRGLQRPFSAYVVAYAWRGEQSRDAIVAFTADLLGERPRLIDVPGGLHLAAGGAAHAIAYIGHNRLMDLAPGDVRAVLAQSRAAAPRPKGMIAVACWTVAYLLGLTAPERPPLLLTADLLFAGSHAFEGAAVALLHGAAMPAVREAAAATYASGQGKSVNRVRSAFTNPADPRWQRLRARFAAR